MKKQVLFIHGAGEGAYEADKKLAASLQQSLGPAYEVHCPAMPDEENAPYEQWKQHIGQEIATMQGPIMLVGHSVGASVLIKCMSEIEVQQPVAAVCQEWCKMVSQASGSSETVASVQRHRTGANSCPRYETPPTSSCCAS
jgi:thioesterase domain-containing protein